jgi:hypothetical protein
MHRPRNRFVCGLSALLLCGAVTACSSGPGASPPAPAPNPALPLLPTAPRLKSPAPAPAATITPPLGYDISHPQCLKTLPADGGFGIVGITRGKPLTTNPCLAAQLQWARGHRGYAVYVNTSYPRHTDPVAWGRAIARDAVKREHASGNAGVPMWWLDVETANDWVGTPQENATVLDSVAATLQQAGARVGVYSSPAMWPEIAGAWKPPLPNWLASGPGTAGKALAACAGRGFSGYRPALVQWVHNTRRGRLDHDLICPSMRAHARDILVVN